MQNRPTTEERLNQRAPNTLMRYFLILMTVLYMVLGVCLWVAPIPLDITPNTRRILGGVFVVYGIIRFVRIYRENFQNQSSRHDRTIR